MKLTFATTFDANNLSKWSGTPFHMARGLEENNILVDRIGNLKRRLPAHFKIKQLFNKIIWQQRDSPRFNITAAKFFSEQMALKMTARDSDAILSPQINPIAYLDGNWPIILWTDSLYANLLGFYPSFANHSQSSIRQGHTLVRECLSRCRLAIFSSDWAAATALNVYNTPPDKIKTVPFGANIIIRHTLNDIHRFVKKRDHKTIKLLFLGKDWHRKGGEIVLKTAESLHRAGESVEVNVVGCYPPSSVSLPKFIQCHGFISKDSPEGQEKITKLFQEAHFLFVPSRAEAYGIVFCEANAFGVPCLATNIGGITTIIKDNINGMTFSSDAAIDAYCQYILNLKQNPQEYEELALASFNEYQTRLNWGVATGTVKELIKRIL